MRPDVIPGVPLYIDDPTVAGGRRFNPAALTPGPTNRQGTLPRNAFRGFPISQVDLAIRRQFELSERMRLQFRAEFFNILNHPNFADPGNFQGNILSNALFGQSTQMLASGPPPTPFLSCKHSAPINHLESIFAKAPVSVDSKKLTEHLSPLSATLTKNPGGGKPTPTILFSRLML